MDREKDQALLSLGKSNTLLLSNNMISQSVLKQVALYDQMNQLSQSVSALRGRIDDSLDIRSIGEMHVAPGGVGSAVFWSRSVGLTRCVVSAGFPSARRR